jgi:hypothetical protein
MRDQAMQFTFLGVSTLMMHAQSNALKMRRNVLSRTSILTGTSSAHLQMTVASVWA